ncbi:hypothetical protein ACOTFH_29750 [Achromobacter xylosoxidans]|uniref:HeH/LEM domain-containing protein n=1 Tax=Achromobacter pulmonis TaxID=1389932 RepID=A0A6S7DTH1_9BURK|nr:hypothetical protein [Achromobacter pulmonis]CAB3859193.1 hypothetical protein LMG26788_02171 [Achromobacter pulmonis]
MKLTKTIRGVPEGEIYPVEYAAGEDCPSWLLPAARDLGAVEEANDDPPELVALRAQLDALEIKYDKRWGMEKLRAALAEGKRD